jgi:preprotein translocase subunit SecE
MSSNTRWVVLAYGILSLLAMILLTKLTDTILAAADLGEPMLSIIHVSSLVGLVGGVITFVVLFKHPRMTPFSLDVIKEIKKVTWPTIPETRAATLVVIVLVIIISLVLGLFDFIFANLTNLIYS